MTATDRGPIAVGCDRWEFIVRALGSPTVLHQSDDEGDAVRYCLRCDRPARVIRTADDESIYCNI
jgi:hypothetical protein